MPMYVCPYCKKKRVNDHFMRCTACYKPIRKDQLRRGKKK